MYIESLWKKVQTASIQIKCYVMYNCSISFSNFREVTKIPLQAALRASSGLTAQKNAVVRTTRSATRYLASVCADRDGKASSVTSPALKALSASNVNTNAVALLASRAITSRASAAAPPVITEPTALNDVPPANGAKIASKPVNATPRTTSAGDSLKKILNFSS